MAGVSAFWFLWLSLQAGAPATAGVKQCAQGERELTFTADGTGGWVCKESLPPDLILRSVTYLCKQWAMLIVCIVCLLDAA